MYVNSQEREKFWGTLLSLSGENREADKETLAQTIKYPPQLCRYRAVTDGSLHSLRTNTLRFSTADRYDDPFDTFLHIDHHALLDEFLEGFKTIESTESILNHIRQIDAHPLHDLIEAGMTPQQLQHLVSRSPMAEYFSQAALYAREIAQKSTRSICFSENTQNEALWLKYAEHHRGFALIYKHPFYAECGSSSSRTLHASLYPICYTDKAYDATRFLKILLSHLTEAILAEPIPLLDGAFGNDHWERERVSLIKKKCHEYDEEWRLLATPSTPQTITWRPDAVILGLRISSENEKKVIDAAKEAGIPHIYKTRIDEENRLSTSEF